MTYKDYLDNSKEILAVRAILTSCRDKALEKYKEKISHISGMNNGFDNDFYRGVTREFSYFLAELDKELRLPFVYYDAKQNEAVNLLGRTKNAIVDVMCPIRERGGKEYYENQRKASKLAGVLEDALNAAFYIGVSLNHNLSDDEKKKIDSDWEKRLHSDQNEAYARGSRMLVELLKMRIASDEVDKELTDRGL